MIRMLHLADLHIGMENYGRLDPATGIHSRLSDYLARLDEAIDLGQREAIDLVLIAGDIYKNRSPNPTHQREFARRVKRMRALGWPVFILTGNHDISPSAGRAHSVEVFAALELEGVTVCDRPRRYLIETASGPLQIVAVPWVTRQMMISREELRALTFVEVESELRRRLDRFVVDQAAQLDPTIPAVLCFHGTVDGATLGAERQITLGQDLALSRATLAQPQFSYVALGHIHKHQALGNQPPLVYAGSIERIDFGERDEPKGCVIADLALGSAEWQFHPLAARPFVSLELDLRSVSDPQQRISAAIARQPLADAVVRLLVRASREQAAVLDEVPIRSELEAAGAFVIAAISIDVEREGRRRLVAAEEQLAGLTPRRALEIYLRSKDLPEERIAALLAAADELIAEEAGEQAAPLPNLDPEEDLETALDDENF